MLRVGLTGGLGSGKSTAAHLFATLGVHVIEADEVGRALMQPGQAVYAELVQHFGTRIVRSDGALDRAALADLAFRQGRLQELNQIVHPPVIAAQEEWMKKVFAADGKAIAMVESALIFEADRSGSAPGWRQRFNRIVLVTAPDEVKIERYVKRISQSRLPDAQTSAGGPASTDSQSLGEAAKLRLAAQVPDDEKAKQSDYVIDNAGPISQMENAVNAVYLKLKAEAEAVLVPSALGGWPGSWT